MNNLEIYENLRYVPENAKKSFNNGKFSGTDINPMWRIKKMTEQFGPVGIGWYTEVVNRELQTAPDGKTIVTFMAINLYVKVDGEWSKPIYGEGGNTFCTFTNRGYLSVDDEGYKKAYTDALSNATKALGLGADVWFQKDVKFGTKYELQQERNNDTRPQEQQPNTTPSELMQRIQAIQTIDDLNALIEPIRKGSQEEMDAYVNKVRDLNAKFDKATQKYILKS